MKYIDYKKRMEFNEEDYKDIDKYCKLCGVEWYASVWDIPSLEFMVNFNPHFIKIPSSLITNKELLEKCKDINQEIYGVETAIHLASGNGHVEVVKILLEKGILLKLIIRFLNLVLNCAFRYS
jgi:N-acetylneuraminate synthase